MRVRAQVLVIIALGLLGLVTFTALAVDGSRVYMARRKAQNAADAAALAMGWEWLRSGRDCRAAEAKGLAMAAALGYNNDGVTNTVEVYCPPQTGQYAGQDEHFQTLITVNTETTFLGLVGWSRVASTVEAVARAYDGVPFGSNAIVGLAEDGVGIALGGNSTIQIVGGGMLSNSSHEKWSIRQNGSSVTLMLEPGYTLNASGNCWNLSDPDLCRPGVPQIDAEAWAAQLDRIVPGIPTAPACEATSNSDLELSGDVAMDGQDVYCLQDRSVGRKSNARLVDVTLWGSLVLIVEDGDVIFDGKVREKSANIDSSIEIYLKGSGTVRFTDKAQVKVDRLRIYAYEDGNVEFQAKASVESDNALLYLNSGRLDWDGQAQVKMCAPPQDDPDGFGGLVAFLKEYSGPQAITLNGNNDNWMAGTFLAPKAEVKINGTASYTAPKVRCYGRTTQGLPSQVIGYRVDLSGNSNIYIEYNADLLFKAPIIELLK